MTNNTPIAYKKEHAVKRWHAQCLLLPEVLRFEGLQYLHLTLLYLISQYRYLKG